MIPYSVPLVLLLMASTTRASEPLPHVEWISCLSGDALCYIRGKCAATFYGDLDLLLFLPTMGDQTPCAVAASLRPVTNREWRVRLRVAEAIDPAQGIHVYLDDEKIVGCKQDTGGAIVAEGKAGLPLEMVGTESAFTADGGLCSVRIVNSTSLSGTDATLSIRYSPAGGAGPETIVKATQSANLYKNVYTSFHCDASTLTALLTTGTPGFKKIEIPDPGAEKIECPGGDLPFVGGIAKNDAVQVTEFKCNSGRNSYTYKDKSDAEVDYVNKEIFCRVPIETTCAPLKKRSGIVEPEMKTDSAGKKRLECAATNNPKVLINSQFYVTDMQKLKCKNKDNSNGDGAWFAEMPDGLLTPVVTAECAEKFKCSITFNGKPPNLVKSPRGKKKEEEEEEEKEISMEERATRNGMFIGCRFKEMSLVVRQDDTKYTPESIVCDGETGRWVTTPPLTGQELVLKADANIYCELRPRSPAAAAMRWYDIMDYVCIPFPFLGLLCSLLCYFFWWRKKFGRAAKTEAALETSGGGPLETEEQMAVRLALMERTKMNRAMAKMKWSLQKWRPWEYVLFPKAWNNVTPRAKRAYIKFIIKRNVPSLPIDPDELPMPRETEEDAKAFDVEKNKLVADEENRKLRRIFSGTELMDLLDCLFDVEYTPAVWKEMLPFLFFVERNFFHADQTNDLSKVEKNRTIPAYFYEHFRKYLLRKSAEVLKRFDDGKVTEMAATEEKKAEKKRDAGGKDEEGRKEGDDEEKKEGEEEEAEKEVKNKPPPPDPKAEAAPVTGPVSGFVKGIALIIQYKLLTDKDEKEKLLDRIFADYKKERMGMKGASRMAVWGILRHEDCPATRRPGVHEYFGPASKSTVMYDDLLEEFNNLLKKDGDFPRSDEGTKLQHVLFAMGCSVERTAMSEVWKALNSDQRFWPEDFMWVMYGRDWLWDGAWCAMTQRPNENYRFAKRFGQDCEEYKELAEMCTRYWADKYSKDAKKGYCFETLALQYNKKFLVGPLLDRIHARADRWERKRGVYAQQMHEWLCKHDAANIPAGFTAKGEELTEAAKAKPPTAESKELAALANRAVPKDKPKPPQEEPSSGSNAPPDAKKVVPKGP